jgi:hypothetical protein
MPKSGDRCPDRPGWIAISRSHFAEREAQNRHGHCGVSLLGYVSIEINDFNFLSRLFARVDHGMQIRNVM